MVEIVYSAAPELRRPGRFLAAAGRDLRASLPIGWRLFLSNVRVRYRRSWFGYVWLLLPAIGTALIAGFIQSRRIVAIAPTELPYGLFVLSGIIAWQLFIEALNAPLQQLQAGRQLVTRSRVPSEALVLAGALETALNASVRLLILAGAVWWFGAAFAPEMLLLPAAMAALGLLGLGIGLLLAPVGLLFDDVGRAITLVVSFGFFVTPIVYPIPAGSPLAVNPLVPMFGTIRALLGGEGVAEGFWAVTVAGLLLLTFAWLFHRLARPHFVARLG